MPAKLKNGVIGAPGGKREGAGRPKEWLRQKCQAIVDKENLIEFLAHVANGESVEQAVGNEGEVISVPAAVRDRIKATELLLDRGFGKAEQALDVKVDDITNRPSKDELESALKSVRDAIERAGMAEEK